jgi:hypothetical protein
MSIGFESEEVTLRKLRGRLHNMSDEELIRFGNAARKLAEPRVSPGPGPWQVQLQMAREEWRRRHRNPQADER